jgi:DNA-binding SARP family transcriptional activator
MKTEFFVLGPLEVHYEGTLVEINARMQRALIASFLNGSSSMSTIIEDLWGREPPSTAAATVRNYVRRLRTLFPDPILLNAPGGYRLAISPEQVDTYRFGVLVVQARAQRSDRLFRAALEMWRGDPLRDLAGIPIHATFAPKWEESYLGALEDHVDLRLEWGERATLVPDLTERVCRYPLRERLSGQLMIALHGSGRPAEALSVYRVARARLIADLGMEPSKNLQLLERAILRDEPVPLPTAGPPSLFAGWNSKWQTLRPGLV